MSEVIAVVTGTKVTENFEWGNKRSMNPIPSRQEAWCCRYPSVMNSFYWLFEYLGLVGFLDSLPKKKNSYSHYDQMRKIPKILWPNIFCKIWSERSLD